ncbi:hypothetical protein BH18ACI4_BH18ACI4_28700 [soil metagenome]
MEQAIREIMSNVMTEAIDKAIASLIEKQTQVATEVTRGAIATELRPYVERLDDVARENDELRARLVQRRWWQLWNL